MGKASHRGHRGGKGSLLATVLFALVAATAAVAEDTPGVTTTEIKIGNTNPYGGPASAYSVIAKLEAVFFKMVNDQGGVAGRKINFISLDDGYSPPKILEQVRRLIEQDHVALLFDTTGAACNSAIQKYVNQKQVPHLFLGTGADKFGDYQHYPWTMGFQPSYQTEARIYAKYILKEKPNAADTTDGNYVFAYSISKAMLKVLEQCEGNFTRENIMKQATNLHDLELPTLLPGIRVNTSPTNYHPIRQMQLGKFDGIHWIPLGDLVTDAGN
jgi:ABC-type branched-subunit amino acid transport system substrate-binding protein